jgi:hypothetical protein
MASKAYCSSVADELARWSGKLHRLSSDIERIPSIDKYKLLPQIEQLHIIMAELDDRLGDLINSCETIEESSVKKAVGGKRTTSMAGDEKFDYEVGG